jgi:hypothetical protein
MYFQCDYDHKLETISSSVDRAQHVGKEYRVFPTRGLGNDHRALRRRLVEYYSRELSFNTDVVNAFLDIVEAFTDPFGLTAKYFYGILLLVCNKTNGARHQTVYLHKNESSFLSNLLWTVTSGVEHHTPSSKTSHRGPGHRSKPIGHQTFPVV